MELSLADGALEHARSGWEIFPLGARSKVPAFPQIHPQGDPLRETCKGMCGQDGHGLYDATRDEVKITRWWAASPTYNVGGRVPAGLFVLDIDPRHGGLVNLEKLVAEHHGEWHKTRASETGGGGWHFLFIHPGGKISQARLPDGVEIKTHGGYIVLPPSIHPDSGKRYEWHAEPRPIVDAAPWLIELLRPLTPVARPKPTMPTGDSIADWFTDSHGWRDVLIGWALVGGDGEGDGSKWRHPTATSPVSATVRHGCLFVYSPTPGLPVTTPGDTHGLTTFAAWAHLEHGGNQSKAASAARDLKQRTGR